MRAPTGRRSAAAIAVVLTALLVASSSTAIVAATAPPGLARFMAAVGSVESGGNYTARNPVSGRLRQVPDHAVELAGLGTPVPGRRERATDATEPGQGRCRQDDLALPLARQLAPGRLLVADRIVADDRVVDLRQALRGQGHGPLPVGRSGLDVDADTHVQRTIGQDRVPRHVAAGPTRRVRWRGRPVRHVEGGECHLHVHRSERGLEWARPARPAARPRSTSTAPTSRPSTCAAPDFDPRATVFRRSWSTSSAHTLTIVVVGTKGRPMVAIDDFKVAP